MPRHPPNAQARDAGDCVGAAARREKLNVSIPPPVLEADRVHHAVLERVVFSRHLNPANEAAARAAFDRGAAAPPFEYQPLLGADALLAELAAARPPADHPAGALMCRCLDETALLIRALSERSAALFSELAELADWFPSAEDLTQPLPEGGADRERADVSADLMIAVLQEALGSRGLHAWRVETDTVMSARVLVDSARKVVRVHPGARFRMRDLTRLVAHEVDVHAVRGFNGAGQALRCFETGLPGALCTEEGLALVAEERVGAASPGVLPRQRLVCQAILVAREAGFRDLYEWLRDRAGPELAWGVSLRVKRGLSHPGLPGVYAKDSVYLRGRMAVHRWLEAGGPIEHLYVGKVSVNDPVRQWIDEGWVQPRPVPSLWRAAAQST